MVCAGGRSQSIEGRWKAVNALEINELKSMIVDDHHYYPYHQACHHPHVKMLTTLIGNIYDNTAHALVSKKIM
jgi:hypothetical protein